MLGLAFAILIVGLNLLVVLIVQEPAVQSEPSSQLALLGVGVKGRLSGLTLGGLAAFEVKTAAVRIRRSDSQLGNIGEEYDKEDEEENDEDDGEDEEKNDNDDNDDEPPFDSGLGLKLVDVSDRDPLVGAAVSASPDLVKSPLRPNSLERPPSTDRPASRDRGLAVGFIKKTHSVRRLATTPPLSERGRGSVGMAVDDVAPKREQGELGQARERDKGARRLLKGVREKQRAWSAGREAQRSLRAAEEAELEVGILTVPLVPAVLSMLRNRAFAALLPAWICDSMAGAMTMAMLVFYVR